MRSAIGRGRTFRSACPAVDHRRPRRPGSRVNEDRTVAVVFNGEIPHYTSCANRCSRRPPLLTGHSTPSAGQLYEDPVRLPARESKVCARSRCGTRARADWMARDRGIKPLISRAPRRVRSARTQGPARTSGGVARSRFLRPPLLSIKNVRRAQRVPRLGQLRGGPRGGVLGGRSTPRGGECRLRQPADLEKPKRRTRSGHAGDRAGCRCAPTFRTRIPFRAASIHPAWSRCSPTRREQDQTSTLVRDDNNSQQGRDRRFARGSRTLRH